MARTNKYTSINFNHIHEKNVATTNSNPGKHPSQSSSSSSSSSSSLYSTGSSPNSFANTNYLYKSHLPSARSHGRMLVLSRPTPKPVPTSTATTSPLSPSTKISTTQLAVVEVNDTPDRKLHEPDLDRISLRPLGRTGSGLLGSSPILGLERDKEVGSFVGSPKPDKFVPPHLRPGFVGREERPGPEVFRGQRQHQIQQQQRQGNFGSPVAGQYEDERPKSGGGYERMGRGGEAEPGLVGRPRSSGNRPSSSGW